MCKQAYECACFFNKGLNTVKEHLFSGDIDCINLCRPKLRLFPNNKSWVTPDLKALLNKKMGAFISGNNEGL